MQMSRKSRGIQVGVLAAACAAVLTASCIDSRQAPALSGPSTFGQSLTLIATPDRLPRDGRSQALVAVRALDEIAAAPISQQRIALVATPSTATLSSAEVTTDADGLATFTVTAPPASEDDYSTILVRATPVGGLAGRMNPNSLSIGLVFDDPVPGPAARFTVTPAQPRVGEQALFDGSASTAGTETVITTYVWTFGDGSMHVSSTPTVEKAYDEDRTFPVTLTVTDNLGESHTTAQSVTVVP